MLIFIGGPRPWEVKKKLEEKTTELKKKFGNGIVFYNFEAKNNFSELASLFDSVSMFSPRKAIVLTMLFKKENNHFRNDLDDLFGASKKNDSTTLIIYEPSEVDAENKNKLEKESDEFYYFDIFSEANLKKWIKERMASKGITYSDGLAEGLFYLKDPLTIENELEKLSCYLEGKKILPGGNSKYLLEFISHKNTSEAFDIIKHILSGHREKSIKIVHRQIKNGISEQIILGAIHYQLKKLIKLKNMLNRKKTKTEIAKILKMPAYAVDKNIALISNIGFQKLKNAQERILDCDYKIKSGRVDSKTALDFLIGEI